MHDVINSFLTENNLTRCDLGFTPGVSYTYANESQNYYSKLDYFVSDGAVVTDFDIIDISSNLSDHLPIIVKCLVNSTVVNSIGEKCHNSRSVKRLRWDRGDLLTYYTNTEQQLQRIFMSYCMQSREVFSAVILSCLMKCTNI